jgi:hypothetical protein
MFTTHRAVRAALVVGAGALTIIGVSSTAAAQRRMGMAAQPLPRPTRSARIATAVIDPFFHGRRRNFGQFFPGQRSFGEFVLQRGFGEFRRRRHFGEFGRSPFAYFPGGCGYGYGYGYGDGYGDGYGGVYDTNGRPLSSYYDVMAQSPWPSPMGAPVGTPDLSGSPYVVVEGGMMVVDFGNADRRAIPSCAQRALDGTPDGRPRTIFHRPPEDAVVLRPGQSGRVLGTPTAGARVCYTVDAYGRMVLDY